MISLHYASNNKEVYVFIISHSANINEKDNYGKTALHYAANNINLANLLISYGTKL